MGGYGTAEEEMNEIIKKKKLETETDRYKTRDAGWGTPSELPLLPRLFRLSVSILKAPKSLSGSLVAGWPGVGIWNLTDSGARDEPKRWAHPQSQSCCLNSLLTCTQGVSILMAQRRIDRTGSVSIHSIARWRERRVDERMERPGHSPLAGLYFEFVPKRT